MPQLAVSLTCACARLCVCGQLLISDANSIGFDGGDSRTRLHTSLVPAKGGEIEDSTARVHAFNPSSAPEKGRRCMRGPVRG